MLNIQQEDVHAARLDLRKPIRCSWGNTLLWKMQRKGYTSSFD